MAGKTQIALIYGGKSTEHAISLISAQHIFANLSPDKYDITLIAIDAQGRWFWQSNGNTAQNLPTEFDETRLITIHTDPSSYQFSTPNGPLPKIDVAFPVLHGLNGEDGTIQGLLRCLTLPFVGCDVLSTAMCMDKEAMKQALSATNIPVANWQAVHAHELSRLDIEPIIASLGLPLFVKPMNAGSSIGVIKVEHATDLIAALQEASQYDQKILIESMICGREIECAVLGNEEPKCSLPGEILVNSKHEFYSYAAKYLDDNGAKLAIPAKLTDTQIEHIQQKAIDAFKALHCEGMARVDCFLLPDNSVIINEINTIPGFTPISMYPKLWEASGKMPTTLVDELIQLALEKFDCQMSLKMSYQES